MSDVVRHFKVKYPKADVRSLALVDLRAAPMHAEEERPRALDFVALKVRGTNITLPWQGQDREMPQRHSASRSNATITAARPAHARTQTWWTQNDHEERFGYEDPIETPI